MASYNYDLIPEKYQMIVDCIGAEEFEKLIHEFGGTQLYIPTMKEVKKNEVYQKVREQSGMFSVSELARIHNISTCTVYRILRNQV